MSRRLAMVVFGAITIVELTALTAPTAHAHDRSDHD